MEIEEQVGSRTFAAKLIPNGIVAIREGQIESTQLTLSDALAALAQENNDEHILESTIGDALRALLRQYARVV